MNISVLQLVAAVGEQVNSLLLVSHAERKACIDYRDGTFGTERNFGVARREARGSCLIDRADPPPLHHHHQQHHQKKTKIQFD